MDIELQRYMQSLPHTLMVKTHEEDRLIEEFHKAVGNTGQVKVWNSAYGLMSSGQYMDEWVQLKHPQDTPSMNIHTALVEMYKSRDAVNPTDPKNKGNRLNLFYIILDADRYLSDGQVQRRVKNLAVAASHDEAVLRTVIFVSSTGNIPMTLDPYLPLHDFSSPNDELIRHVAGSLEKQVRQFLPDLTIPEGRQGSEIPEEFVAACRGLTVFQIKQQITHHLSTDRKITVKDMVDYRKSVIMKSNLLELMETDVTFADIAGLERLKARLAEVGTAWTPEGRAYGVPVSRGLLQLGIPGCGKSLIAKALANEMGVTFVRFDPSNIFSSRVGDSEQNMRTALQHIEAVSPCVVFVDEIEKGLSGMQSSSHSDGGTTARVIGTFLSWFQDHSSDIFVIATANSIKDLPPELISRFEEKYFVNLPGIDAREDCFRIQAAKYWGPQMGNIEKIDFETLAVHSNNLTGREIEQVMCDAIRKAFMTEAKHVTTEILLEAVKNKPPLIQTMHEQIRELVEWIGYDPLKQEGVRARFASDSDVAGLTELVEEVQNSRFSQLAKVDGLN